MRRLVARHIRGLNSYVYYQPRDAEQHTKISTALVNNVLLCLSANQYVHLPETLELDSCPDYACVRGAAPEVS